MRCRMPREYPRSRRIEEQIQRLLSDFLRTQVRDPRVAGVVLTAVRVSRDLGVACAPTRPLARR